MFLSLHIHPSLLHHFASFFIYVFPFPPLMQSNLNKAPNVEVVSLLNQLCSDPKNVVFLVSGRGRENLSDWFQQCQKLGLAAEHGYFYRSEIAFIFPDNAVVDTIVIPGSLFNFVPKYQLVKDHPLGESHDPCGSHLEGSGSSCTFTVHRIHRWVFS